jgi:hypothetical protein
MARVDMTTGPDVGCKAHVGETIPPTCRGLDKGKQLEGIRYFPAGSEIIISFANTYLICWPSSPPEPWESRSIPFYPSRSTTAGRVSR